jgi:hypothetical protein
MPVELFRAGELELDCYKIDLVQGTHESPFSMHGRGFIGQNADGHITFKVYPTEIVNPPAAGDDGLAGEEGKLIPSGRNWCRGGIGVSSFFLGRTSAQAMDRHCEASDGHALRL